MLRWLSDFKTDRFAGYSLDHLRKDAQAGLVVGIIAIPLGMAFAIATGVKPEYGIYTSIIAGIIISLCGGSRFQIGGPTGAFVPILFGIVLTYGYENLLIAGFMAGVILFVLGVFKLGSYIKFVPRPVIIGFTTGIAVIIFTDQIANFLGLSGIEKQESFIANIREIVMNLHTINVYNVATAIVCLIVILGSAKKLPRFPSSLVALVTSTLVAALLFSNKVPTIGTVYGDIPSTFPAFQMPEITWEKLQMLFIPALLIALLGAIESLLSTMVADGMTSDKHNSNRELIGQGFANIITPLFGGIPATGAIARTATNIKSGAVSPLSGVIHGIVVLLVLLIFAPFASQIPLASMAPILMIVAWNMSERKRFTYILKLKSTDSIVLIVTFALTVFVNLTVGVGVGLLISFILFAIRMTRVTIQIKSDPLSSHPSDVKDVMTIDLEGVLFFGAAQNFELALQRVIEQKPLILIVDMSGVAYMDVTGTSYFSEKIHKIQQYGGKVLITGLKPSLRELFMKTRLIEMIGAQHFYQTKNDAIDAVRQTIHEQQVQEGGIQ